MTHRPDRFVPKLWGLEIWYVDDDNYCGKKIIILDSCGTSMHYHNSRDKTILVVKGTCRIEWNDRGKDFTLLSLGDSLRIKPGVAHRLVAPNGQGTLELIEFSTQHHENDSIRINKRSPLHPDN